MAKYTGAQFFRGHTDTVEQSDKPKPKCHMHQNQVTGTYAVYTVFRKKKHPLTLSSISL